MNRQNDPFWRHMRTRQIITSLGDIRASGWPLALLEAVLGTVDDIPADIEASIAFALGKLGDRQRAVILGRYRDCMTYAAIAQRLGISTQGAQENHKKAIALLQTPANRRYLDQGLQQLEDQRRARMESVITEPHRWEARRQELGLLVGADNAEAILRYEIREGTISVTSLELPVRAQNQLRNKRITTLVELCQMTGYDLYRMRQVGEITQSAILEKMRQIGLSFKEDESGFDYRYYSVRQNPERMHLKLRANTNVGE